MTFEVVFYHIYLLFRFAIPFFVALILFNLGTERRSYFPIRIIFSSIVYLAFSVMMNELDLRGNFHLDWLHPCFILIFIFVNLKFLNLSSFGLLTMLFNSKHNNEKASFTNFSLYFLEILSHSSSNLLLSIFY